MLLLFNKGFIVRQKLYILYTLLHYLSRFFYEFYDCSWSDWHYLYYFEKVWLISCSGSLYVSLWIWSIERLLACNYPLCSWQLAGYAEKFAFARWLLIALMLFYGIRRVAELRTGIWELESWERETGSCEREGATRNWDLACQRQMFYMRVAAFLLLRCCCCCRCSCCLWGQQCFVWRSHK